MFPITRVPFWGVPIFDPQPVLKLERVASSQAHQLHRASTACRSAGPDRGGVGTHATELLRAALPHARGTGNPELKRNNRLDLFQNAIHDSARLMKIGQFIGTVLAQLSA